MTNKQTQIMNNEFSTFETGKTYKHNWAGDSALWTKYVVTRRTAKSIWIVPARSPQATPMRKSINVYHDGEAVSMGSYSMAPILRAKRIVEEAQPVMQVVKEDSYTELFDALIS